MFLYLLDRLLKLATIVHFFRRPAPPPPTPWPSVTIIAPITRARHDMRGPLVGCARLAYPGPQQHLVICDITDEANRQLVQQVQAEHPEWNSTLLLVTPANGLIAPKLDKMNIALPQAKGDVLVFLDDDVTLRPDALQTLLPYLEEPQAGAAFGLACYSDWHNLPSSLISAFVNANALPSYIPLSYLTEPYTITGHCFALRRTTFDAIGGFNGMVDRIDDDHELARRLRIRGLRCIQTPMIYEVENNLPTLAAANEQLKRWFVFPREAMLPFLTSRERIATALGSLGTMLPPLIALLEAISFFAPQNAKRKMQNAKLVLLTFLTTFFIYEGYLGRRMPWWRWPLLLVIALINPLHILTILKGDNVINWRGQRMKVFAGGKFEVF
jgi:ceramide glucosyltransferase